jgi:glucosyl-3-phosphoglycerate phosphatase
MPTTILLLRHGQSTWNAEGRWQGQSDPPLSPLGREQAEEAAGKLADVGVTAVVTSDLDRARTTGQVLADALGLGPPAEDRDLREYDVGDWEGLTRPEIESGWPEQLAAWKEGRLLATPGGETRSAFLERIMAALRRVAAADELGDVAVVVTHGGVIRAAEQVTGGERQAVIGNLAGRWFLAGPDGELRPEDATNLLDPEHRTAPPSP